MMNYKEKTKEELLTELLKLQDLYNKDKEDREKVEMALRESEENYRTLIQYSSDPIFCFNPDETYRFANESFACHFGKTPKELIGKTPHFIFPFEEAEKRLTLVRQVFKTGLSGEIEVIVNHHLGDIKYFITRVDPVKDDQGNIMWVSCISKDITERKLSEIKIQKQNEELVDLNATKDKLFSIIAHDLRGPFNSVMGFSQMMVDHIDEFGKDIIKEYSNYIYGSAKQAFILLENLLEWSKLQQGLIEPVFSKQNLKEIVREIENLYNDTLINKKITLHNLIDRNTFVSCDKDMTAVILRNLISNAFKFTNSGGVVSISSTISNSDIEIHITDTGIGISPEKISSLFEVNSSVSTVGTDGEKGTGLGLLLCKEFVEKQGGKIWVESKPGKGSKFIFTIPLNKN